MAATSPPGDLYGISPASSFRVVSPSCKDCPTIPQALWYFEKDDLIAVPKQAEETAGFQIGLDPFVDLARWAAAAPDPRRQLPPLVWIGSPAVIARAALSADGRSIDTPAGHIFFQPCPKIGSNRSYWNDSSVAWFSSRQIRLRGKHDDKTGTFVARTVWPTEWRLPCGPLAETEHLLPAAYPLFARGGNSSLIRMQVRSPALGAKSLDEATRTFFSQVLWSRQLAESEQTEPRQPPKAEARRRLRCATEGPDGEPSKDTSNPSRPSSPVIGKDLCAFAGRPVIAILLNGAQGDDDEALGGHFAVATGRVGPAGECADWLVHNLYPLSFYSEKGIVPAPTPLDNYMCDLNSGQSWYRPNYMMVAVLSDERPVAQIQAAFGRLFNQLYRQRLVYEHTVMNCTSISIDLFRTLGWSIPTRGATSWLRAMLALPAVSLRERSIRRGKDFFDYLSEDCTRLFPHVAFEELCGDLLHMTAIQSSADPPHSLRSLVSSSLEGLAFMRLPQLPSSRKWGTFPIASLAEYRTRWPEDPAKRQIVPCPSRPPLPPHLRDKDLVGRRWHRSDTALLVDAVLVVLLVAWLLHLALGYPFVLVAASCLALALPAVAPMVLR